MVVCYTHKIKLKRGYNNRYMAGIITDVKSDIQRLKELKSAIDDVKKSIVSININVDINITLIPQLNCDSLVKKI